MTSSDKFCLKWSDFQASISQSFYELREEKELFDVTLACEDEQIQAHKTVLSACSPFFKSVLKKNPHQHPLLYLKGIKYSDLLPILDFMYQGEVNIEQEHLNSFLEVADELKIKGLMNSSSRPGPENINKPSNPDLIQLPNAVFSKANEKKNQISEVFIDVEDDLILEEIYGHGLQSESYISYDKNEYMNDSKTIPYEGNFNLDLL